MNDVEKMPRSLIEAVSYFADERKAWKCFVHRRWPTAVSCPRCGSVKVHLIETRMVWRCNGCTRQFSVKVGTIFEDSAIGFAKWLPAMWLICNAKNGVSSCELARSLGVTQKTAWHMLHRIRLAMQSGSFEKMGGKGGTPVETDETFIGGKGINMHKRRKIAMGLTSGPLSGKEIVMGILERGSGVRLFHIATNKRDDLEPRLRAHVHEDSTVYTDANPAYGHTLANYFRHETIDHAYAYVEGQVHTNGMENFWSLLKRTLKGTYIHVEPYQLFRYLDEQAFRFNERQGTDSDRFEKALKQAINRRLTYNELAGKTPETSSQVTAAGA
ncbi:MAG: IS1595 family transposase [Fimbriimonadaceae bacterium]